MAGHDHDHGHDHGHVHGADCGCAPAPGAGPALTLDHVNIRTHQVDALTDWYAAVLGLRPGPRPEFPFPGAWLYAGEAAVVHLVGVAVAPVADPDQLRLEHLAFRGQDLDGFLTHLHGLGVTFRLGRTPGGAVTQVNVWDPDGNHLHVDFPA